MSRNAIKNFGESVLSAPYTSGVDTVLHLTDATPFAGDPGLVVVKKAATSEYVIFKYSAVDEMADTLTISAVLFGDGIDLDTGDLVEDTPTQQHIDERALDVGNEVKDATTNTVLFADSSGNLASSSILTWTGSRFAVGTASPGGKLHVLPSSGSTIASIIQGSSGQSANLTEWQDNSGAVRASVGPNGILSRSITTDINGLTFTNEVAATGPTGGASMLDLYNKRTDYGGHFMRCWIDGAAVGLTAGTPFPRIYVNGGGHIYTQGALTISGTFTGTGTDTNIVPPFPGQGCLGIWSDVYGPCIATRVPMGGPPPGTT